MALPTSPWPGREHIALPCQQRAWPQDPGELGAPEFLKVSKIVCVYAFLEKGIQRVCRFTKGLDQRRDKACGLEQLRYWASPRPSPGCFWDRPALPGQHPLQGGDPGRKGWCLGRMVPWSEGRMVLGVQKPEETAFQ